MQYLIPSAPAIFEEEIKKSRFITYLQHCEGIEQARLFWHEIKKLHPTARHHCWAAIGAQPNNSLEFGFSDDGEPNGTAGKPMLSALLGAGVGEISAVVVRYYGGILLGTGGLVRAYSNGVQQALQLLTTELKIERRIYRIQVDYPLINSVQRLCEKYNVLIVKQQFAQNVEFELALSGDRIKEFSAMLQEYSAGKLSLWSKEENS